MKKIFNKYKEFFKDLLVNTFSFAIYILAQQLLFMPIMGKMLPERSFANFVIYSSIFSILTNSLGNELGITNQVVDTKNDDSKYIKILINISIIIFIISMLGCYILQYTIFDSVMLSIVMVLANCRLYVSGHFRKNKLFKNVLIQNIFYLLGIVIGLIVYQYIKIIFIPSLLAEIISFIYYIKKYNIIKYMNSKEIVDKKIVKNFSSFSFVSFLGNILTYFDKIIIYPILGSYSVNVYYSTSTMSKVINMIINPIHSVLLSWINKGDKNKIKIMIINSIKVSFIFSIIAFFISIPITYLAVKLLYNQYIVDAQAIIIPVSCALGFSVGMSIIKSFVMKFLSNKNLVLMYILYLIVFVVCSILMSKQLGLIGFAYSSVIAKVFIYFEFVIALCIANNKGEFDEK